MGNFVSGRAISRPALSGKKGHDGEQNCDDNDSNSGSAQQLGRKNDQAVHGAITSALWAIARTPALVTAVEHVETNFGEVPRLSGLLRQLRDPNNLGDMPRLREAADAADAFLRDNDSGLSLYSGMESMDIIRGIVGLCGDSDKVFEEAVETTYRYFASVSIDICSRSASGWPAFCSPSKWV